jgi:hypothetical protein
VKTILELIKTCLTDLQNVPKICNIQQGFSVSADLEAQKYANLPLTYGGASRGLSQAMFEI